MPESVVAAGDKWAKKIEADFHQWVEANEDKKPSEWGIFDLTPHINGATLEGVELAGEQLGELGLGIKFDLRNPYTEAWIKQYAAQEIKYIDDSSKAAIKQIILRGQEEGITSQEQARMIREHIGLDPRRSTALLNYEQALTEAGISPAALTKELARYRQKLINDRAMNIALTEGHTAANEGYRQGNAEAVKRGVLDPREWERYWMVTRDKRTCPICNSLSGATAELPGGHFPKGGGRGPIRHNRCRCTEGLRTKTLQISSRKYEVSADNITNTTVLNKVLDKFDALADKYQIGDKFGGFRSLDNDKVPMSIKRNAGDAFVTARGQAFDAAGNKLRDEIGDPIDKVFIYLPPKNINEGIFSEDLARMGIVHNGSLDGVITHEFGHVLQFTATNKFGREIPKSVLYAADTAFEEAGITARMLQKNVSMYANGFGAGDLKDSERFAELFTAVNAPSDKVSKEFAKRLLKYQQRANEIFTSEEYGGVGKIV